MRVPSTGGKKITAINLRQQLYSNGNIKLLLSKLNHITTLVSLRKEGQPFIFKKNVCYFHLP